MAIKAFGQPFDEEEPVLYKALGGEMDLVPDSRQIRFVISDGAVDRDNDTIAADGWDLTNYRRNPVVLWAHSHSDLPIAKCVQLGIEQGRLVATAEFATHAFAETVYQLLKGGFMKATSVGFRALEYVRNEVRQGIDFKKQELLEFSIVPVPANQNALQLAASKGIDLEPVREWIEATILDWPGELRLKGRAWEKFAGARPGFEQTVSAGELSTTIKVDGSQAIEEIGQIEAVIDRVLAKTATLDDRLKLLAAGHGHTRKAETFGDVSGTYADKSGAYADDPIRWNRSLSKAFDVAAAEFPAQSLEQELASKYLETPIAGLHHGEARIRSARMGAFLFALDEFLAADGAGNVVHMAAVRNIDRYGKEAPPLYEDIQLNSTTTRNFLVDGMRFFEWGDAKICLRVEPRWYGLSVTHYSVREQEHAGSAALEKVQARAKGLNFLKGEAFTLAGEFLVRGDESPDDLILDAKNAAAVTRLMALVNDKGAGMECRGALLVGPPGTGKTLSGRILMNHAKATFIWVSSRDFAYSGGFQGMQDAFEIARECAPSVLFVEDVDNWLDGVTVDLMKTEMDGIRQHKGVLTILTTNYPELLPKALIDRPGRFHDVLRFDLPAEPVRAAMLAKWLPGLSAADTQAAVAATAGMSGAHMRELARFATIIAEQDGLDKSAALAKALEKLQEQRDLITSIQATGSRYRAPSAIAEKTALDLTLPPSVFINGASGPESFAFAAGAALGDVLKRGRVISAANEAKLKKAMEHSESCMKALEAVIASSTPAPMPGEPMPEDDGKDFVEVADPPPSALAQAAGAIELIEADYVEMTDASDDAFEIDDAALRQALREVVGGAMGAMVRETTQRTLNQMRGRVD